MNPSIDARLDKFLNDYVSGQCTCALGACTYHEAKEAIKKLISDPFDYVEPCEPDCTDVRHAYHQGQWDLAVRMTELSNPTQENSSGGFEDGFPYTEDET